MRAWRILGPVLWILALVMPALAFDAFIPAGAGGPMTCAPMCVM